MCVLPARQSLDIFFQSGREAAVIKYLWFLLIFVEVVFTVSYLNKISYVHFIS